MGIPKVKPPDSTIRGFKSRWGSSDPLSRNGTRGEAKPIELAGHTWESHGGYAMDGSKESRAWMRSVAGVK